MTQPGCPIGTLGVILSPRVIRGSDQLLCVGDGVVIAISVRMVVTIQHGSIVIES